MSYAPEMPTAGAVPQPRTPLDRIDLDEVRHPLETSRLALAITASAVVVALALLLLVGLGRTVEVWLVLLGLVLLLLLVRVVLMLWRIRLIGDAVWVSADTLPEVQDVIDEVRQRLDYSRRVDVVVVDKMSRVLSAEAAPVVLTSFFGVRVLVLEAQVLGDLATPAQRPERVFLFATYFGALSARHAGWAPLLLALEASGLPMLVFLFVYPWYRATTYTGDRIAYACCGDLDVGLQSVYRVLVGAELAPHLRTPGLVEQALTVRHHRLLRLGQLLRPTPYAPTRYLDLLSFAAQHDPEKATRYLSALRAPSPRLHEALRQLQARRPRPDLVPVATGAAGVLVLAALVGGVAIAQASDDSTGSDGFGPPSASFSVSAPWTFDVDNDQPDEFTCWVQLVDESGDVVVDHVSDQETDGYEIDQSGTFFVRMYEGDESTCSAWYSTPDTDWTRIG